MKPRIGFADFYIAFCVLIVLACTALTCAGASEVPPPRLARRLPPEAHARAADRARRGEALRELLRAEGVPLGAGSSNAAARAAALGRIRSAPSGRAIPPAPAPLGGHGRPSISGTAGPVPGKQNKER